MGINGDKKVRVAKVLLLPRIEMSNGTCETEEEQFALVRYIEYAERMNQLDSRLECVYF